MKLKIGQLNELQVVRKTDIAYLLKSSDGEGFLTQNESSDKIRPGSMPFYILTLKGV